MAELVYVLCFLTSAAVAFLLLRAYWRTPRVRILLWTGLGFIGLSLNNALLSIDAIVVPGVDLSYYRALPALIGMAILVFGLIWEGD